MNEASSPLASPVSAALAPVIQVEDAAVDLGGRTIWQHVQLSVIWVSATWATDRN